MQKVHLTIEERRTYALAMDELELAQLDPTQLAKYRQRQKELVYGEDFKSDANGNPIEQGVGSSHRQTSQHLEALERERRRGSLNTRILEAASSADPNITARMLAEADLPAMQEEMARLKRRIATLEASQEAPAS
jgi:hypothetical protein